VRRETDPDRALAILHELSRDVVDCRDVIGVDGVSQAERISEQRRSSSSGRDEKSQNAKPQATTLSPIKKA